MSWLLIYILISFLLLLGCYLAVRFIQPRCPDWWERHISAPDPEEQKQIFYVVNWANQGEYIDEKNNCFIECFANPYPGENEFTNT